MLCLYIRITVNENIHTVVMWLNGELLMCGYALDLT